MFGLEPFVLGIALALLALFMFGAAWFLLRATPKEPMAATLPPALAPETLDLQQNRDAMLVIGKGGKLLFVNQVLREWFSLASDELPNLEYLTRRAHPADIFLGLCAAPGQARFSLQGLLVEGSSYQIPFHESNATLVALRHPDFALMAKSDTAAPGQAFAIIAELSQAMTASLDFESTLQAVMQSVERLIPADLSEITVWDAEREHLTPYVFVGLPGMDRHLEKSAYRYKMGEGYSGYLLNHREPLLIADVRAFEQARHIENKSPFPFESYLGTPLLMGGEIIGTIELASLKPNAFDQSAYELLQLLSGQAAIAIKNAITHQDEERRVAELTGLARLAGSVGMLDEPRDLFANLVKSIQPLLNVATLGFLLYDEEHNQLVGQVPFLGMQERFVEWYSTELPPNSEAEALWLSQNPILAENAPEDETLNQLGLGHLAQAAGIQSTALVALSLRGRSLGYMQAANKLDKTPFTAEDIRLMAIIAGQAAPIIENVRLVQEARKRTQQAEALRRIASLVSSAATLDEILALSLLEISRLARADSAAVFLMAPDYGALQLHLDSMVGIPLERARLLQSIPAEDPAFMETTASTGQIAATGIAGHPSQVPTVYKAFTRALGLASFIIVPITVRDKGAGEILVGSRQPDYYVRGDVELISSAAGQLAAAVERTRPQSLVGAQSDDRLLRRVEELTALARISHELSVTTQVDQLLERTYHEVIYNTSADGGAMTLVQEANPQDGLIPDLRVLLRFGASSNEPLTPVEIECLQSSATILVNDYLKSDYPAPRQGIGTSLVIPMLYQEALIGVVHLHAKTPGRFDTDAVETAQTITAQAANALGNVTRQQAQKRQADQFKRSLAHLSTLITSEVVIGNGQPLTQVLSKLCASAQEATSLENLWVSLYEPETRTLQPVPSAMQRRPAVLWEFVEPLLTPEIARGKAFILGEKQAAVLSPELRSFFLIPQAVEEQVSTLAGPPVFVLLPLFSRAGSQVPLGLVSAVVPSDALPLEETFLQTLEVIASQAANLILGHNQVGDLRHQVTHLQSEVQRAQTASQAAARQIPLLLRKDLDQSVAIHRIQNKTQRVHAGLEIVEALQAAASGSIPPTRAAVLDRFAQEVFERMQFDTTLVAESGEGGPVLLKIVGVLPETGHPEALLGQKNPLRQVLRTGEMVAVANLQSSPAGKEWQNTPLISILGANSFICLPIYKLDPAAGSLPSEKVQVEAALLAIGRDPLPEFTLDDLEIFEMIARQATATLKNIQVREETTRRLREVDLLLDFSRQLGRLEASEIVANLVESALKVIGPAQAAMVGLWDPRAEMLVIQAASGYQSNQRLLEIRLRLGEGLPGRVLAERTAQRIPEINLARDYNLTPQNLRYYQEAVGGVVPLSSLVVPLMAGAHALGVLVLDNFTTPDAFHQEDMLLISSLTQQVGLILENVRLLQAADQRAAQLQALTDVAGTMTSNLQVGTIIASLLDHLRTVLPFDTGTLWLRQDQQMTVRAAKGFEDEESRIGLTVNVSDSRLLNEMIDTGQPIYVADTLEDSRFFVSEIETKRSWLGIPLISKGEVIGVLAVDKSDPEAYSKESLQAVTTFAGQAAIALENARLFEDSQQRTRELDDRTQRLALLNRLSNELGGTLELEGLLDTTLQNLLQAVPATRGSIILMDEHGLPSLVAENLPQDVPGKDVSIFRTPLPYEVPNAPIIEHLRATKGIFFSNNVATEALLEGWQALMEERGTRSLLVLPLDTATEFHGLLVLHGSGERFSSSEIELATTISNQAAVAIENARLFDRTQAALRLGIAQRQDLELRERYQKGVTEAVVTLTEKGVEALPDVLYALGDAAQCSRAFYFESLRNEEGHFWRLVAEWNSFEAQPFAEHSDWVYIPHPEMGVWPEILKTAGRLIGTPRTDENPPQLQARLDKIGVRSFALLGVPGSEEVPGFMGIAEDGAERVWRPEEVEALQTVAAALSTNLAEENLLRQVQAALADTEEQARRLALLNEMSNQINRAEDMEEILEITTQLTQDVLHADRVSIALLDAEFSSYTIAALVGEAGKSPVGQQNDLSGTGVGQALEKNQVITLNEWRPLTGMRTTIVVPLVVRGVPLGTLNAGSKYPLAFATPEQTILQQIATLVTAAIDNKQLLEETRRLTEELEERVIERTRQLEAEHVRTETLLQIITELSGSLDMDIVLNRTLDLVNDIVGAEQSTIMLAQPDQPALIHRASHGYTTPPAKGGGPTDLQVNQGLAGWVISHREAVLIPDLPLDPRWIQKGQELVEHRSAIAVPLLMGEDVLGALLLFHREANRFTEDQLDLVQATAKQIAVAINNAQLFLLIRDQAERLGVMMRNQQVEANRLRAILEAVADGVLVTDAAGKISIFNASAEHILGMQSGQVIGKALESFIGLFGGAGQRWTKTIQSWSSDPSDRTETFSERITLENGRHVAVNLAPVIWRSEFLGTVSIFRDITHQVEVDRLKSEFVANVSHELRTPMTSIKGYVDIMLMGAAGPLPDAAVNFLGVVKNNADRLNILVNDLLDVSRIDAGRYSFSLQQAKLDETIEKVLAALRERSAKENRQMEFEFTPPVNFPRVHADPERLYQIVENLVENAYIYTPAGGKVRVQIQQVADTFAQVDIIDNGIGIAPEHQGRIFERFFRGEDALVLASSGTGLGLSIVQYLVEMHNGKIWFTSEGIPGKGSTFSFTIPIYQPEKQ